MSDMNGTGEVENAPAAAPIEVPATAGKMRASIFSSAKRTFKSEVVEFFGERVEIRQPSLGDILGENMDNSPKQGIMVLLKYAYVPGSNEKVFSDADEEMLLSMPFGEDFNNVVKAFARVTGTDIKVAEKNFATTR